MRAFSASKVNPKLAPTCAIRGDSVFVGQKTRVGAVRYLNTKPLVHGLSGLAPQIELSFDLPSRLADDLAGGRLEVALIPSIEYFQDPAYRIVSDACIACRGPVWSVKLFSRVPPERIRTLALDEGSRTSVALVQILLREKYDLQPELEALPIGSGLADTRADAVLLIGDRAIHPPAGPFAAVWDLGERWEAWSGLPFVFAMWVARAGVEAEGLDILLSRARDAGVADLDRIAASESAAVGLTRQECLAYFRDNLHFHLGEDELAGLELFRQYAESLGMAPPGGRLEFFAPAGQGAR